MGFAYDFTNNRKNIQRANDLKRKNKAKLINLAHSPEAYKQKLADS
jgi:hypothetical protein